MSEAKLEKLSNDAVLWGLSKLDSQSGIAPNTYHKAARHTNHKVLLCFSLRP